MPGAAAIIIEVRFDNYKVCGLVHIYGPGLFSPLKSIHNFITKEI